MDLQKPQDLFMLESGDVVTKRNLYDLIRDSKIEGSYYWAGPRMSIGNTPQQGINWIGQLSKCRGVIIKTRPGIYKYDGWVNEEKTFFRYSFKARNGTISYSEKANKVLINQSTNLYPIFLFTDHKDSWIFEGSFSVFQIEEKYVILRKHPEESTI